ncbi:MAG: PilZ domain-containing protein [Candidatus Eremiobacteraeota bacterium]|nr:PilZ domain-containing protein [Candidatus Eremiobacteraeota bacterium]MBV8222060.1 PilZ domain-containing protein [Candidatus Eremiobacteraeota bacterium]MBV8281030.1 PilZ domain-containing protein [Candidatus Eremiobacteraeota bacterium]
MTQDDAGELHVDRRRFPRFNIKLPIEFTIMGQERRYRAMVDNISLAGVLLVTDEPLTQGTRVIVHLPSAPGVRLDIQAEIVRASVVGEFGVAFVRMTEDEIERVTALVERRSAL